MLAALGLLAVLGGVLATCGVVAGLIAASASTGEQGVSLGSQVPQKTVRELQTRKLLAEDETLLAYYDATISLDMSEVTLVTSARVVHSKDGTVASAQLGDVTKITQRSEPLIGDIIEISTRDGGGMKVEIAPLNGADMFIGRLEETWQKHVPGAAVVRTGKR